MSLLSRMFFHSVDAFLYIYLNIATKIQKYVNSFNMLDIAIGNFFFICFYNSFASHSTCYLAMYIFLFILIYYVVTENNCDNKVFYCKIYRIALSVYLSSERCSYLLILKKLLF